MCFGLVWGGVDILLLVPCVGNRPHGDGYGSRSPPEFARLAHVVTLHICNLSHGLVESDQNISYTLVEFDQDWVAQWLEHLAYILEIWGGLSSNPRLVTFFCTYWQLRVT